MSTVSTLARAACWAGLALASLSCSDNTPPVAPENGTATEGLSIDGARRWTSGSRTTDARMIVLKPGTQVDLSGEVTRLGGRVKRSHREVGILTATGLSDAAAANLARHPAVESVIRSFRLQSIKPSKLRVVHGLAAARGNRPRPATDQSGALAFADQWNLRVIQADDAWLTTNQGAGARVGVMDSGIDPNHIDLFGTVDPSCSESFLEGENPLVDFVFHGTFVAGIIKTRGIVVASVAPDAILCSLKVADANGAFTDAVASALIFAALNGIDVVNLSYGVAIPLDDPEAKPFIHAFQRIINFASSHGVLFVASAGNDAVNTNTDPKNQFFAFGEFQHVISVGATSPVAQQNFDQIASYSNFGRDGVDVFAPGGDFVAGGVDQDLILSPCSASSLFFDCGDGLGYLIGSGTSFATPHVVGEAAVIESQFPGDQKDEFLTQCIFKSADLVNGQRIDPLYGHGRINVLRGAACAPATGNGIASR